MGLGRTYSDAMTLNNSATLAAISAPEVLLVLAVVALLFGTTRIPKLARSLGQAQKEFKEGQADNKQAENKKSQEDTPSN